MQPSRENGPMRPPATRFRADPDRPAQSTRIAVYRVVAHIRFPRPATTASHAAGEAPGQQDPARGRSATLRSAAPGLANGTPPQPSDTEPALSGGSERRRGVAVPIVYPGKAVPVRAMFLHQNARRRYANRSPRRQHRGPQFAWPTGLIRRSEPAGLCSGRVVRPRRRPPHHRSPVQIWKSRTSIGRCAPHHTTA